MNTPTQKQILRVKDKYKKGDRVKLTRMNDRQAPPIGTLGTVKGVDDMGSVLVSWDNGSCLSVVFFEDACVKL